MKTIICGGRSYTFNDADYAWLNRLHEEYRFTQVISGGAKGADRNGEIWARLNNIPVRVFKADWDKFGWAAGFFRNAEMTQHADAAIIFPGGKGTADMGRRAREKGLVIFQQATSTKNKT